MPRVAQENMLVDISTENEALFFNASSDQDIRTTALDPTMAPSAPPLPTTPPSALTKREDVDVNVLVYDIQKLVRRRVLRMMICCKQQY